MTGNSLSVPADAAGRRLDAWLAETRPALSRARWKQLIEQDRVRVDDLTCKPRLLLAGGETVVFEIPDPAPALPQPEALPLTFLYQDEDLAVLNKAAGMVTHPAPGHYTGTLVNALLYHCGDLTGIGGDMRPGIVHRLDKDTSGAMVIVKNEQAMQGLARQFRAHNIRKEYLAIVRGTPAPAVGTIETPIGRSSSNRQKMTVMSERGRHAVTHYTLVESFGDAALMRIRIETGRTHQIRVHMTHLGHPLLGDRLYGQARSGSSLPLPERQMLHAESLAFTHPRTGKALEFIAPMPEDMRALIRELRIRKDGIKTP